MLSPIFSNLIYGCMAGGLCILFMMLAYFLFDWLTPFDTGKQIDLKNQAVGTIISGIFIGVGIAMGLVIGLSLN